MSVKTVTEELYQSARDSGMAFNLLCLRKKPLDPVLTTADPSNVEVEKRPSSRGSSKADYFTTHSLLLEHKGYKRTAHPRMALDEHVGGREPNKDGTPSTASRVKAAPVESVFTTPTPRRDLSKDSASGRKSPAPPIPFIFVPKSSPAPRQHKSVEVLGTNARTNSSVMSAAGDLEKQFMQKEVSKKNSQHFDQVFAVREPYHSAKSRIQRDSMIVLELQLNCSLDEKERFVNNLLHNISETYHRPADTITINVNTDTEIIMGGTTAPAYLLTITALATEIAPAKNMRATSLIQGFLAHDLGVPQDRGVIKFQPISDSNLATNGMTVLQEIEKAEQEAGEEKRGLSLRSRQSSRPNKRSQLPTTSEATGEMEKSRSDTPILSQATDEEETKTSTGARLKARRSIMSFFKR